MRNLTDLEYIELAVLEHGNAVRDNSRSEELIAIGRSIHLGELTDTEYAELAKKHFKGYSDDLAVLTFKALVEMGKTLRAKGLA